MVEYCESEYSTDHEQDVGEQYIPYPTDTIEPSEVANEAPEICVEGSRHGELEVLEMEVSKPGECGESGCAREYMEGEPRLLVDHVEYVDIFDTDRIVEVFTAERIFEIDDIGICG